MTLREFVEMYVCKNTIIRLWTPIGGGHRLLGEDGSKDTCMEWELLKGQVWQSQYNNCEFVGVTDIVTRNCMEAVNLVIKEEVKCD